MNIKEEYRPIITQICSELGVTLQEVESPLKQHDVVKCRNLIMTIIHSKRKYSLQKIGGLFNRDHATVLHAIRNCKSRIKVDNEYKSLYIKHGGNEFGIKSNDGRNDILEEIQEKEAVISQYKKVIDQYTKDINLLKRELIRKLK